MSRDAEGRSVVDVTLAESIAEYSKYSGWPELKESFMAGKVRAAYLLAPMVMDLVDSGVKAKIVSLGHRSGAVIMVRADSTARTIKDLRGRRVAIPSRFAVDHLFVRRMLKEEGMTVRDVELVEMAPPEMPAALYARQVDAYATGEPFGAVAEVAGYARILYMTRDKWPNYVCCVLTVHHIGRSGSNARGASAIDGAQDTELKLERVGGPRSMRARGFPTPVAEHRGAARRIAADRRGRCRGHRGSPGESQTRATFA